MTDQVARHENARSENDGPGIAGPKIVRHENDGSKRNTTMLMDVWSVGCDGV